MTLTIKVWDVRDGLAVYANTPDGKHIIIDAGVGSHEEGDFYPLLLSVGFYQMLAGFFRLESHS